MRTCPHGETGALFLSTRPAFEVLDLGHIGGDAATVFAFARTVTALRLGDVVVLRHGRLLGFISVIEIRAKGKSNSVPGESESASGDFRGESGAPSGSDHLINDSRLRASGSDQLDAVAEGIEDVAAAHVGEVGDFSDFDSCRS
jgi:hypothetical protein